MRSNLKSIFGLTLSFAIALIFAPSIAAGQTADGQTIASGSAQGEVATAAKSPASNAAKPSTPAFTAYRGVRIGMSAEEVRSTIDGLKKGEAQDLLVSSERETAQIYYDDQGKVIAVSIDYFGDNSNAPLPDAVLGAAVQVKADGSMYQLNRYPEAGYWVSYNRTAGDKPIVTITMQKM